MISARARPAALRMRRSGDLGPSPPGCIGGEASCFIPSQYSIGLFTIVTNRSGKILKDLALVRGTLDATWEVGRRGK